MGQELYSCDTTQIDACASARFTRHHACPVDNGWVPVGIYLVARSSRPRKSIHSAAPRPDPTAQGSLKVCRAGYYSFSQVSCCLVVGAIIAAPSPLCQPPIFSPGEKGKDQGRRGRRPLLLSGERFRRLRAASDFANSGKVTKTPFRNLRFLKISLRKPLILACVFHPARGRTFKEADHLRPLPLVA